MEILSRAEIIKAIDAKDLTGVIEEGFRAYSNGMSVIPPVGELLFEKPPGEVHIKYGYIAGDRHYVIKIASGFAGNPSLGFPSGNGMMLLFDSRTGMPECLLLDEGYLTDVRTALAGAIAAKYLAPPAVQRIGILGTGVQARMQLQYLKPVTECRRVIVLGRSTQKLEQYRQDMEWEGYSVATTTDAHDITETCSLIVTATSASLPLMQADWIKPGTHITAMGSDTAGKQELDPMILARANLVVADSKPQCMVRGEISHAVRRGLIGETSVVELGEIISGKAAGRTSASQITVADLTGVAVQDIQIAKAVYSLCST
jgi:ornithine cyclodeaminase